MEDPCRTNSSPEAFRNLVSSRSSKNKHSRSCHLLYDFRVLIMMILPVPTQQFTLLKSSAKEKHHWVW